MSHPSFFENDNPLRIWFLQPSSKVPHITSYDNDIWQQNTIPIGNGFIGANVFGEIKDELLTFNELTLWHGGPSPKRPNYNGGNNLEKGKNGSTFRQIQQLLQEGKDKEADSLCNELVGDKDGYGSYIEFGRIKINFDINEKDVKNYVRWLDLDQAITYVQYEYEGAIITREYFVSYPDNVLVIHIKTNKEKVPKFNVSFSTQTKSKNEQKVSNNSIIFKGRLDDNEMIFDFILKASSKTGSIVAEGSSLSISDSNEIFLFVSASTDYKDIYPTYRTGETESDVENRVLQIVNKANEKGFELIRKDHLEDYMSLFSRVTLDLGQKASQNPTNEQLQKYKNGGNNDEESRDLEVLLFQYGRYLTIESSREKGKLPSNLQGIWNDKVEGVPWMSDYHMNINLQMNYWPTYVTNLHECAIPLINYVEGLRIPGRITAEIYTGVISNNKEKQENGFMAHTQNTPFGWTCPGWDFSWGWSPAAVPWILQNVFDYYLFTNDEEILRNRIYPMMKEAAILYDQIMIYSKRYDRLVSSPTYSPEHGPRTEGNAYEQALIWQHYNNTIRAAEILNVDSDYVLKWKEKMLLLKPIEIGDSGQIKEWYNETFLGSIGSKHHRHLSHLLGLYPGDLISVDNKEWMNAAIVSLIDRGDESTGWGMGQRINAWARTGDGNHAYKLVKNLLTKGIYNNLWDTHPPFQIDGNFGATSGIAEMLLQSNQGYINILPSLPDIWSCGKFDGLVARGKIVVGVSWENKKPVEVRLKPSFTKDLIVECKGIKLAKIMNQEGQNISFSVITDNRISFKGKAGHSYVINQFIRS